MGVLSIWAIHSPPSAGGVGIVMGFVGVVYRAVMVLGLLRSWWLVSFFSFRFGAGPGLDTGHSFVFWGKIGVSKMGGLCSLAGSFPGMLLSKMVPGVHRFARLDRHDVTCSYGIHCYH